MSNHEQIAQVAQDKWSTVSDSLRLLRGNEQLWANCSGRWPKMSKWVNSAFFEQIAHFFSESLIHSFSGKREKTVQIIDKPRSYFTVFYLNYESKLLNLHFWESTLIYETNWGYKTSRLKASTITLTKDCGIHFLDKTRQDYIQYFAIHTSRRLLRHRY